METLKYWVWITMAMGSTNHRIWDLTAKYDTIVHAYDAISSGKYDGMTQKEIQSFKTTTLEQADEIIEYCNNHNIRVICFDDEINFPNRLREIYNPPTIIFCYGDLSYIDDSITLGVVGARKPTEYSVRVCEDICTKLAKVGTVIVSGFAYGIDSIAHKSALEEKSRTVAVLGCGLDYNYPEGNAKFKSIIAKHGAVITEYFPGTKPFTDNFRKRNRLISALSLGVLVVQASNKSGALNTVAHAVSQGRDIFCVPPHDVFDSRYVGVINLLRDGAIPVFSHLDIMYEYYENFSHKLNFTNPYDEYSKKSESVVFFSERKEAFEDDDATKSKKIKSSLDNESEDKTDTKLIAQKNNTDNEMQFVIPKIDYSELDNIQSRIVCLLKDGVLLADELSVKLQLNISDILVALTELEVLGYIKSLPGNRYSL